MADLQRGDVVIVRDYQGVELERYVWSADGDGVQVCTASEYDRGMLGLSGEPLYAGFPKSDVVRVMGDGYV